MSSDGRYVVFGSMATNLVPGDTNNLVDVFVHDREGLVTTRVSPSSSGGQAEGGDSRDASINSDGRYVAFESRAENLVSGDMNGSPDIFLHDRQNGETARVSVAQRRRALRGIRIACVRPGCR
jgi:Tol biopolymer transport system component